MVARSAPPEPVRIALDCLNGRDLRAEIVDGAALSALRDACAGELANATEGWGLSEAARDAVFATFVAHRFAPYGASRATTFEAIVHEPALDCDNYLILVDHLLQRFRPDAALTYVGFDGGRIGNHAQAFFSDASGTLFLDPTVGVVAVTDFDSLLMGRTVSGSRIIVDAREPASAVEWLHGNVLVSLVEGSYRPSDLLYYYSNRDELLSFGVHTAGLGRRDVDELLLHYPTPGARTLRSNLKSQ